MKMLVGVKKTEKKKKAIKITILGIGSEYTKTDEIIVVILHYRCFL